MMRLIGRIEALEGRLMSRAKRAAVSAAEQAAKLARELAPVDTGELRLSISFSPKADGAAVTASAPHAAMVEYGTSKTPPQPFMLPAAQAVQAEFFRSAGENNR